MGLRDINFEKLGGGICEIQVRETMAPLVGDAGDVSPAAEVEITHYSGSDYTVFLKPGNWDRTTRKCMGEGLSRDLEIAAAMYEAGIVAIMKKHGFEPKE